MPWERQQKSVTANAVLKRRHISHDIANLKQYPEITWATRRRIVSPFLYTSRMSTSRDDDVHGRGMGTLGSLQRQNPNNHLTRAGSTGTAGALLFTRAVIYGSS
ncbi:hypothetical protein CCUS01_11218 [Colletotrichum cuscutae]|uniref:DUF3295 domain-containing protein n=1 Tax=Colletotrichum cuscutae TaxID=1209917 RepID=A0AAI9U3J9_9PEZI|nr:hypothetical protein CCUS01_11218 [Colletotrichum cuscutae]